MMAHDRWPRKDGPPSPEMSLAAGTNRGAAQSPSPAPRRAAPRRRSPGRSHAYSARAATRRAAGCPAGWQQATPAAVPESGRAAAARPGRGAAVPDARLRPAVRRRVTDTQRQRGPAAQPGRPAASTGPPRPAAGEQPAAGEVPAGTAASRSAATGQPAAPPHPATGQGRGIAAAARPVRAGAGRDAGRYPAAPPDDDLDHRAGPVPDPAAGADAHRRPAPPATPGGGPASRRGRDRDDRGGQRRPAIRALAVRLEHTAPRPASWVARPARADGCAPRWRPRSRPRPGALRVSPRTGCAGRRGSACTCGPTRRGTGRCGRPG